MNWYLAKIVFRIICGDGDHTAQFDEQLRLVSGHSKEEAFRKAQELGQAGEERFMNQKQQIVQWQFINVAELYQLGEMLEGAELFSRIEEREPASVYIETVHKKAENIFFTQTHQLLHLA